VRLPAEELGRHAVDLLVAKLEGKQPPPLMLLPPRLSRRASTPDHAAHRGATG
jgi:DNA-binding LacI/PurR family transcriptional regulator